MKKNFGIIALSVLLLTGLSGCNDVVVNSAWENDKANHWHEVVGDSDEKKDFGLHTFIKDETKSKDATCTAKGLLVEKCSDCGYVRETITAMLPHEFVKDNTRSKDANCEEAGEIVEKCAHCPEERITPIAALGHNWVADPTDARNHESTHTSHGISVDKCTTCGDTKENVLPMEAHTWVEVTGGEFTTTSGKTVKKWGCECGTYSYTMNVYDFDFLSAGSNAYGIDGYTPGTDAGNANGIRIAGNGSIYWNFPIVAEGLCQISIGANPAPTSIGGTAIESKNSIKVNDVTQTLIPSGAYRNLPITVGKFDELLFAEFTSTSEMVGKEAKIEITQKPSSRLYFGGVVRVTIITTK